MEFITILANTPFINTFVLYAAMVLIWGTWGAFAIPHLEVLFQARTPTLEPEPINRCLVWPIPQDWTAQTPCSYSTSPMANEPAPYRDVVSTARLEELFYGYTMDQLEEAMEVVAILAKVQDPAAEMISLWENVLGVSLSDEPVVEEDETSADAWAHLEEVMNEVPFIGYIGDGRSYTTYMGGQPAPVFSWASL